MTSEQSQKAKTLLGLHSGPDLLVLPNVWDPIGARVLASKGYSAIATASAAISSSLGYRDGEVIGRDTMLEVVARICRAVDVPVTADMESGYAASLKELQNTTEALLDTGAVGLNIEDSLQEGAQLRPVRDQADRIATIREAALVRNVHLVINARVDTYLSGTFANAQERLEEAVMRAEAYAGAGADCVYPIGPGDEGTLTKLRSRIGLPINVLATPDAIALPKMADIGINRVSFGPFIFRSCLRKFADIADALSASEGYECFSRHMMTRDQTAEFLSDKRTPEELRRVK